MKLNDAELIGTPTTVVVGRGLTTGTVEVTDRASGGRQDVPLDDAVAHLSAVCGRPVAVL